MIDATSKGIMITYKHHLYDIVCWGTCVKKRAQKTGDQGSWSGVVTLACWVNLLKAAWDLRWSWLQIAGVSGQWIAGSCWIYRN